VHSLVTTAARTFVLASTLLCSGCEDDRCHPSGDTVEDDNAIKNGTCAPENTAFEDSFACSNVEGPCPGSDGDASAKVAEDPARLEDPDLTWAAAELAACSCSCCHHIGAIADHRWAWDFSPVWTDSATTEVLSTLIEPAEAQYRIDPGTNNGFSVSELHLPTTDATRMRGYISREIGRR
jgi:hypothetical protein